MVKTDYEKGIDSEYEIEIKATLHWDVREFKHFKEMMSRLTMGKV